MISFLINDNSYPGDITSYRYTNIAIHCLCVVCLFGFTRRFLLDLGLSEVQTVQYALFSVALWALSALNVSTVLYVVQRMTQLSALFSVLGLWGYLVGRRTLVMRGGYSKIGWFYTIVIPAGCGGLAVLSKENGVLLYVYIFAIEVLMRYKNTALQPSRYIWFVSIAPLLILTIYFMSTWSQIEWGYRYREFSLSERLLTQSRILWEYVFHAVAPVGDLGLIHDDFKVSHSLFDPLSTSFAVLMHVMVFVLSWMTRKKFPYVIFAVIWFYGGHILESTFIPLELYFEHRNYLPVYGVYLLSVMFVCRAGMDSKIYIPVLGVCILTGAYFCLQQSKIWGNEKLQTATWALNHPESVRAQSEFVQLLYQSGEVNKATSHLNMMVRKWPNRMHLRLMKLNATCVWGGEAMRVEELAKNTEIIIDKSMITPQLSSSFMLLQNDVCPELINRNLVHVLEVVVAKPYILPSTKANMLLYIAKVHAKYGNLDLVIASLDRAMEYSASSIFYYLQSEYLVGAGLLREAESRLTKAINIENRKLSFKRQNIALYNEMKLYLDKNLVNNGL